MSGSEDARRHAERWGVLHSRLEESRRRLEAGGTRSRDAIERALWQRAERLARPLADATAEAPAITHVVFRAGDARFAVDGAHVAEVWRPPRLTRVPGVPAFVAGVASYRGNLLPIVDLAGDRGVELREGGGAYVVVVAAGDLILGLWADGLPEVARLAEDEIAPPDGVAGPPRAYSRGVTASGICVIDAGALIEADELTVNEEVFTPVAPGDGA